MIEENINGIKLFFNTDGATFAARGLDKGTLAMLSVAALTPSDKVLDLGCGYGVVGIYAAKLIGAQNVVMSDIDEACVRLSIQNAELNGVGEAKVILSDCFDNIHDKDFTIILSNPPYHSDFSVPKRFVEKGFNRLVVGGRMLLVTKRKDWYKNKLTAIFGGVRIYEIDGYYVFLAEKRDTCYASAKRAIV